MNTLSNSPESLQTALMHFVSRVVILSQPSIGRQVTMITQFKETPAGIMPLTHFSVLISDESLKIYTFPTLDLAIAKYCE